MSLMLLIHVVGVLSLLASNVLLLVLILKTSLSGAARTKDTPVCSRPGCPHNPDGPRLVA